MKLTRMSFHQKSRKRQASSEVPSQPMQTKHVRLAKTSIEQTLEEVRVEAEEARMVLPRDNGDGDGGGDGCDNDGGRDRASDGAPKDDNEETGAQVDADIDAEADTRIDTTTATDTGSGSQIKVTSEAQQDEKPVKKASRAISSGMRPKRKRNTLSPEELEYLLGIS